MKKLLLASILSVASLSAQASNWAYLTVSSDCQKSFMINVDNDSNKADTAMFWMGIVNIDKKEPHDTQISYVVGDCESYEYTLQDTTFYLKGNRIETLKQQTPRATAKKGTVIHLAIQTVCKDSYDPDRIFEYSGPKDMAKDAQRILRELNKEIKKMQGSPF